MGSGQCTRITAVSECWGLEMTRKLRILLAVAVFLTASHLLDWGPFDTMVTFAQSGTALTQTTLSATIGSGTQCFQLASVTGISGFGPGIVNPVGGTAAGTGNITDIYIARELMQVISVNATAKVVCVLRGQGGSQSSPHAAGVMVLAGTPGAFFNYDPEGFCAGTNVAQIGSSQSNPPAFTPWVNQRTSAQWICSTITNTWVPGFGNPGISGTPVAQTATVPAAAGVVLPSGPLFVISGAGAITGFTIPVGCNATAVGACSFTVIAAAGSTWTWTAAGNIMTAGTGTAGHTFVFTWSASLSKFVPSALT